MQHCGLQTLAIGGQLAQTLEQDSPATVKHVLMRHTILDTIMLETQTMFIHARHALVMDVAHVTTLIHVRHVITQAMRSTTISLQTEPA